MSKTIKDDCRTVSIYDFKKWDRLDGFDSGQVNWTNSYSEKKNSISYKINTGGLSDEYYMELDYTITDGSTGEKKDIKHKYPIVTTPCNYGGRRYWFECSVYNQGKYCGRRVAKLYLGSGSHFFACRHCYNLSYESRNQGYSYTFPDIDRYREKIKRTHYNGRPTRKYKIWLKMVEQNEKFMMKFLGRF